MLRYGGVEFKGNSIPMGRPRVGEEETSTSLEGVWLNAECSIIMTSGGRWSMCSVPKERVDKSSMATSVTGDSGDSWGGMSVVAIISLRTPKVE